MPNPIINKILFVPSKSRYELEVDKRGDEQAARKYFSSEQVWEDIYDGHLAQKESLSLLKQAFPKIATIDRSELNAENISTHELFVFLGGDNHFTYCAQKILAYQCKYNHDKYVMGIVLDHRKSLGALLSGEVHKLIAQYDKLNKGEYNLEEWTTLEAKVSNGVELEQPLPAVCDYFIGENSRLLMSRNKVWIDEQEVTIDRSSGILITSGAGTGSGSWYDNVHEVMFGEKDIVPRTAELARVMFTEHKSKTKLTLLPGQILTVYSYNDAKGILVPDSHQVHGCSFDIGSVAKIKIGDKKLRVVSLN